MYLNVTPSLENIVLYINNPQKLLKSSFSSEIR